VPTSGMIYRILPRHENLNFFLPPVVSRRRQFAVEEAKNDTVKADKVHEQQQNWTDGNCLQLRHTGTDCGNTDGRGSTLGNRPGGGWVAVGPCQLANGLDCNIITRELPT
jgi:hypothetical protein